MSIFQAVLPPTKWMVDQLVGDEQFSEEVVYRRYTGTAFDPILRHNVDVYEDAPLSAVRMWHNKKSVTVASSEVEIGDMLFLFAGETFPAEHSTKDVVKEANGNELGIKAIDPIFDVAVAVTIVGAK